MNLPSQSVSKAEIQQRWSHLRDVPIDIIDKDVSILIGADLPHLYICPTVISIDQNEPTAMLTKLGWVLLGENRNKSEVSLNYIRSDQNLEHLVEKFWNIKSCGTVNKGDPDSRDSDSLAIDIPTTSTSKGNNRYSVGLLWKEVAPTLSNNKALAISRMISLDKKFDRPPDLHTKYVETINQKQNMPPKLT